MNRGAPAGGKEFPTAAEGSAKLRGLRSESSVAQPKTEVGPGSITPPEKAVLSESSPLMRRRWHRVRMVADIGLEASDSGERTLASLRDLSVSGCRLVTRL